MYQKEIVARKSSAKTVMGANGTANQGIGIFWKIPQKLGAVIQAIWIPDGGWDGESRCNINSSGSSENQNQKFRQWSQMVREAGIDLGKSRTQWTKMTRNYLSGWSGPMIGRSCIGDIKCLQGVAS